MHGESKFQMKDDVSIVICCACSCEVTFLGVPTDRYPKFVQFELAVFFCFHYFGAAVLRMAYWWWALVAPPERMLTTTIPREKNIHTLLRQIANDVGKRDPTSLPRRTWAVAPIHLHRFHTVLPSSFLHGLWGYGCVALECFRVGSHRARGLWTHRAVGELRERSGDE